LQNTWTKVKTLSGITEPMVTKKGIWHVDPLTCMLFNIALV
jgi:hypothetical protein